DLLYEAFVLLVLRTRTHNFQSSLIVGDANGRAVFEFFQKPLIVFPGNVVDDKSRSFRQMIYSLPVVRDAGAHIRIIRPEFLTREARSSIHSAWLRQKCRSPRGECRCSASPASRGSSGWARWDCRGRWRRSRCGIYPKDAKRACWNPYR